ncbi:hypothetical protein [Roseivirga sp. UBA838]|uniref:hypothetical protein n=1 Tax=Roseivirga sp. UBA838 TaxID=1947393 RepID=UPI00257CC2B0|nr:hypothetical protein [Roseivirga sp. UBA838]|tara:strand:- start:1399 stop:4983 length:3585 start_codon:yes stop_codon:yes gene_type:complete
MNKPTLILLIIGSLTCTSLRAQSSGGIQGVVPPTPNAFQMTNFSAQQPNLYTGTSNVNIPLYRFDFEGIKLPISLSYDAGGVKVNQEASEVGLSWTLNATALISRTIEGKDDLVNYGNAKGYVYSQQLVDNIQYGDTYWTNINSGWIDTQPDIFHYNFFGYSGSFTLEQKIVDSGIPAIKLNNDNVKVTFNEADQSFIITTPAGFKGYFSVKERTTSISGTAGTSPATWVSYSNYPSLTDLKNSGRYRNITSWYIERLEAPNGKVVNFEYDLEADGRSKYVSITQPSFGETLSTGSTPMFRTIQEHVYLKSITLSGELNIVFSMEDRYDLERFLGAGGYAPAGSSNIMSSSAYLKRYTSISVIGQGFSTLEKQISFNQGYFNSDYIQQTDAYQFLRSRLNAVTIEDQVYRFEYEYGDFGLPNKSNWGIDNFGYYFKDIQNYDGTTFQRFAINNFSTSTPQNATFYQTSNAKANFDMAKIGALKRVYYPTGGYTEFEYELHDYYVDGANVQNGAESINSNGDAGNVHGGGLRLKGQSTYSEKGQRASKTSYLYVDATNPNKSSGKIMTPLWYYFYWDPENDGTYATRFISANEMLAVHSAQGKNIGYSRVVEVFEGITESYERIYEFENVPTVLQPDWENYRVLGSEAYKNGQLIGETSKNSQGLTVESSTYSYFNSSTGEVKGIRLIFSNNSLEFFFRYKVLQTFDGISQKQTTSYHSSGNIDQTTNYSYNTHYQLQSEETFGSRGKMTRTRYIRPYDLCDNCSSPQVLVDMIQRNLVEPIIETQFEVNNQLVSAQANLFEVDASNLIVLRKTYSYNKDKGSFVPTTGTSFTGGYELENHFTKYDSQGRLLEVVDKAGVYSSLIWGYNNTLPVVRANGVSYNDLLVAYNVALSGSDFESDIRSHSNTSAAYVTTYVHNPFVGMIKQADPNRLSVSYEYDVNERLRHLKDDNGHILKQYDYNFEPAEAKSLILNQGSTDFGVVAPNESKTKVFKIKNTGNTVMDISHLALPTYFYTSFSSFAIAPGETFNLPITFTAPSSQGGVSGGAVIKEVSSGPVYLSFNLSASVETPSRIMSLTSTCAAVTAPFVETTVTIQNSGNDYLEVEQIVLDQADQNDGLEILYNPSGEWRQGISGSYQLPLYIAPQSSGVFRIRYTGSTNINNWDQSANIRIYSNSTNGLPNTYDATVQVKNTCN